MLLGFLASYFVTLTRDVLYFAFFTYTPQQNNDRYCLVGCCRHCRDSIDMEKSPMKTKHVTIETMETVDTEVGDDGHGGKLIK